MVLGFRVVCFGFGVSGLRFQVSVFGFRVQGVGFGKGLPSACPVFHRRSNPARPGLSLGFGV